MDSKMVMVVVSAAVILFVGIWVVSLVGTSTTLPVFTVANETQNFTANVTALSPTNTVFIDVTALYNNSDLTNAITEGTTAGTWKWNASGISVISNGTGGWPNVTTNRFYYYTYTYQNPQSNTTYTMVNNTIWNSFQLIAVALIVVAAVAILGYFGMGRRD